MNPDFAPPQPPRGISRTLYRIPILIYRIGLGWLLDRRFLMVAHTGRLSGQVRRAVLEIMRIDQEGQRYLVASAFGDRSDWYKNVLKEPKVEITIGIRRFSATASPLPAEESRAEIFDYARRYPRVIRALARLIGYRIRGTAEDMEFLARQIPVIEFRLDE